MKNEFIYSLTETEIQRILVDLMGWEVIDVKAFCHSAREHIARRGRPG